VLGGASDLVFDLLIRNGRVVDGTGNPWFRADVAVQDGKITDIGRFGESEGSKILDAKSLVVAPGFIDIHTHSDTVFFSNPTGESHVFQGVTTDIMGNCGNSPAPLSEQTAGRMREQLDRANVSLDWRTLGQYLDKLEQSPISINAGTFVGNGTVRTAAMGFEKREPTESELREMTRLMASAMDDGAYGMSTGLFYAPSGFASTEEVIELAKIVSRSGGIYSTHIRAEGDGLVQSVKEAIRIGEEASIPVQIAHHKAFGQRNWGKVKETLSLFDEAWKRGVQVTCDVYAWRAGATGLSATLPHWAHDGGQDRLRARLRDPEARARMRKDMLDGIPGSESVVHELGWGNIMISSCEKNRGYEGRFVEEIAKSRNVDPFDLVFDLLAEEVGRIGMILFGMSEDDVVTVLQSPYSMIGSDSSAVAPAGALGQGKPHPRTYGNFVKVLGEYVRDRGVLSLEEAVRKMSSFPAQRLGIWDRGMIRKGAWADIAVFDPATVSSRATYQDPVQYPIGMKWVLVNGVLTVDSGMHTGAKAGKVLRMNRN